MTPRSLIAPARLARRPVLATQSDSRLVDLVRAGYEPAFEAIVTRYRAALLRYAERFLPRERAEDAVQQSFVNAYEAMLRSGAEISLRPWLYRIAHNVALNTLRDQAFRHRELPLELDGVERPEEAMERVDGLREVLSAVQALPERQRDAILLRELEGRSYEEIAEELGVSGGSVRQLLNRARNTLRAGATAVTPFGLLARLPWEAASEPVAVRVAELGMTAGTGALAAKVCATALVTGAVAGGVAVAPVGDEDRVAGPERAAASEGGGSAGGGDGRLGARTGPEDGSGSGPGGADRSGPGAGGGRRASDEDSSGPGSGDDRRDRESEDDSSGRGSGDEPRVGDDDSSGSGPGDGSGGSGSGSGSSGSGSGSSGSGSGSSGSGSSDSGSGSSGSGSGSGSSGSGSGSSGVSGSEPEPEIELESALDSSGSGSGSSGSGSSGSR